MSLWAVVLGEFAIAFALWRLGTRFGSFTDEARRGNGQLADAITIGTVLQEQQEIIHAEQQQIIADLKRLKAS